MAGSPINALGKRRLNGKAQMIRAVRWHLRRQKGPDIILNLFKEQQARSAARAIEQRLMRARIAHQS
ncbi:hypothetical protein [Caballeronia calidae]|uniref:hypothetical protein n=1 Tax=Caballeronia calidae TaxID=1777139 RepID=UPI000A9CD4F3|nr:hypothetical protein [Caballeronia calidae]